jgi:hypothetical protein
MPSLVRNLLALLAGIFLGGVVNMALVLLSPALIPPPAGVDLSTPEGLSQGMHLLEPRHFIMPFLAHALGTFAGALVAFLIATSYKPRFAYAFGVLNLIGGVTAAFMIPAPMWFIALDLLVAYLPMAWLAIQVGSRMVGTVPGQASPAR